MIKNNSIKSNNISKNFKDKSVLRNVSFTCNSNEITFLSGLNGAGKTTWIRIACGILIPNSGNVVFENDGKSDLIRKNISVVLDEPPIYPGLSGYDNLKLLSGKRKFKIEYEEKILLSLNIDKDFLLLRAKEYSLGQRHRLAVACALLREPQYLILDEPTIGLDPFSIDLLINVLKEQAQNGSTIIITGQDFHIIENFVDKIVLLHNGTILFDGCISEFKKLGNEQSKNNLADIFKSIINNSEVVK